MQNGDTLLLQSNRVFFGRTLPIVLTDEGITRSFFQIVTQTIVFYLKRDVFKIAPNGIEYLGYFCKKMDCQHLSKIAQPGHTD